MKILDRDIKLAIFDLDGTLLDSTGIWVEIDKNFFAKRNMDVPPGYAEHVVHIGLNKAAEYTRRVYGFQESEEEIIDEWHQASVMMYEQFIPLKEFGKEILQTLKDNNVHLAIATANDEKLYMPCITRLGIKDFFEVITDVNIVNEGKSSPKLYKHICDQFGVLPENTMILEDIPIGLKTAFENGFLSVAVDDLNSRNQDADKKKYSHLFIHSFKELISLIK